MSGFESEYLIKLKSGSEISIHSSSYENFYMVDSEKNKIDILYQYPNFYVVNDTNDSDQKSLSEIENDEMIDVLSTYKASIEREGRYDFSDDDDDDDWDDLYY